MKKILLFLSFLLMSIGVLADDVIVYTLTPSNGSNNSYAGNCDIIIDGVVWNLNGNSQILPWRIGGKSISSVDRTLYSKTTISDNITKIVITHGSASSININSMTVIVSKNSDFSSPESTLTPTFVANNTVTINRPNDKDWANCYYKIKYNVTVTGNDNKFFEFTLAEFHSEGDLYSVIFKNNGINVDTVYSLKYLSRLPQAQTNTLRCKSSSVFVGWSENDFTTMSEKPFDLFQTIKDAPLINSNKTFYAVYADEKVEDERPGSFILTISVGDFNGVSYAANNGYHTNTAISTDSKHPEDTIHITFYTHNIMKQNGKMQWRSSDGDGGVGYVYNSTDLSNITELLLYDKEGEFTKYYGASQNPTSSTDIGTSKGYFCVKKNGKKASYTSRLTVKFTKNIIPKTYSNYTTYCIDTLQLCGSWNDSTKWKNKRVPRFNEAVMLLKPVVIDTAHAVAKYIVMHQHDTCSGKLTIKANQGLDVQDTISVYNGTVYTPTATNDLMLESDQSGNASLIFNNSNKCQAAVQLYTKSKIVSDEEWHWQYIGTAMESLSALYNYYDSWVYRWDTNGWNVVHSGDMMNAWTGYCITQEKAEGEWYNTTGTLVPTDELDTVLKVPAGGDMVFANSWTAPIHISKFYGLISDMNPMSIYLFNTGFAPESSKASTEPGTHVVIPINAAPYVPDSLIAPQQGFFVTNKNGANDASIRLDYGKLVRTNREEAIVAGPMHAPRRSHMSNDKPDVLRIYANGSLYKDNVVILSREDFSTGFDNGWDGEKFSFGTISPSIYVVNDDGSYDAVSAIPNYEGTLLGFRPGTDIAYSLTFEYNGDEILYLNDMSTMESTLIDNASRYIFTSDGSEEIRFVISATPYSGVSTDIDNLSEQSSDAHKFLYNGHLYILKNNCIFNIEGSLIKQ